MLCNAYLNSLKSNCSCIDIFAGDQLDDSNIVLHAIVQSRNTLNFGITYELYAMLECVDSDYSILFESSHDICFHATTMANHDIFGNAKGNGEILCY